mmetsp:Transcript_21125/g.42284  ORF Transcript_21125/g.42284 Transcript_21125/m.42284 type:complete len:234 (-) Transcript_21125:465-1166(-)
MVLLPRLRTGGDKSRLSDCWCSRCFVPPPARLLLFSFCRYDCTRSSLPDDRGVWRPLLSPCATGGDDGSAGDGGAPRCRCFFGDAAVRCRRERLPYADADAFLLLTLLLPGRPETTVSHTLISSKEELPRAAPAPMYDTVRVSSAAAPGKAADRLCFAFWNWFIFAPLCWAVRAVSRARNRSVSSLSGLPEAKLRFEIFRLRWRIEAGLMSFSLSFFFLYTSMFLVMASCSLV